MLEFLRSAQNLLARTEKSSGFRPFLILVGICLAGAWLLLRLELPDNLKLLIAVSLVAAPVGVFLIAYIIKALVDPNFCRSEKHVQQLVKLEIEKLGSKHQQVEAIELEQALLTEATPDSTADVKKLEDT